MQTGGYDRANYFLSNFNTFRNAVKTLKFGESGQPEPDEPILRVGIHSHLGNVYPSDHVLIPLKPDNFVKFEIGTILGDVGVNELDIPIQWNETGQDAYNFYTGFGDPAQFASASNFRLMVGDKGNEEIVAGRIVDKDPIPGFKIDATRRGDLRFKVYFPGARQHHVGEPVYIVPKNGIRFFLSPVKSPTSGKSPIDLAAEQLAVVFSDLGADFLYADGHRNPSNLAFADYRFVPLDATYTEKIALLPFLTEIERLTGSVPLIQMSGNLSSYDFYYSRDWAIGDGTVFKAKELTQKRVAEIFSGDSPFKDILRDLGWWKFHGAYYDDNGKWDFLATTADDVHRAMTSVLAMHNSLGLQWGKHYARHKGVDELYDLMGDYFRLAKRRDTIPADVLAYLENPVRDIGGSGTVPNEAELTVNGDDWQILEKFVSHKVIRLGMDNSKDHVFSIDLSDKFQGSTPTTKPRAEIEIKPRFDYYGLQDVRNVVVHDFQADELASNATINKSIDVVVTNSLPLTFKNKGTADGWASIKIPVRGLDFSGQRGVALSLSGNMSEVEETEVFVTLAAQNQFQRRQFMSTFIGSGIHQLIFDDTSHEGCDWGCNWWMDYEDIHFVEIKLDLKADEEIALLSLTGLAEKTENGQSPLVHPTITVTTDGGERTVSFNNVTLYLDDTNPHLLKYDTSTGQYNVYTSDHQLWSSGNAGVISLSDSDSAFEIAISADTDGSNNSTRADVKIHFFGDEPLAIGSFKDAIPASNQLPTNFEVNNDWAVERKEITKLKALEKIEVGQPLNKCLVASTAAHAENLATTDGGLSVPRNVDDQEHVGKWLFYRHDEILDELLNDLLDSVAAT